MSTDPYVPAGIRLPGPLTPGTCTGWHDLRVHCATAGLPLRDSYGYALPDRDVSGLVHLILTAAFLSAAVGHSYTQAVSTAGQGLTDAIAAGLEICPTTLIGPSPDDIHRLTRLVLGFFITDDTAVTDTPPSACHDGPTCERDTLP